MSQVGDILHVSVLVSDLDRALHFYTEVLGLQIDDGRPDLGYAGAWLWTGRGQIHLLCLPNPDPVHDRPQHGGRDRHFALAVEDFAGFVDRLDRLGIHYSRSRSGRPALFVRDPDGNAIELIGGAA